MTKLPWPNCFHWPRWLRNHIAVVITGLVAGNVLPIIVLVLIMR